jgi:hypothetical protein
MSRTFRLTALATALVLTSGAAVRPAVAATACLAEQSLHSVRGAPSTKITFRNSRASGKLRVYWLDYGGIRVLKATIPPGGAATQLTYATHPFVIADALGNCISVYVAERGTYHVVSVQ